MPSSHQPISNPDGTPFVAPAHSRNPIAQAQNRGISETSMDLSDLWLQELDRRYPNI